MKAFSSLCKVKVLRVLAIMSIALMAMSGASVKASTTASEAASNCAAVAQQLAGIVGNSAYSASAQSSAANALTKVTPTSKISVYGTAGNSTTESRTFIYNSVTYTISVYADGVSACDTVTAELQAAVNNVNSTTSTNKNIRDAQEQINSIMSDTNADLTGAQSTLSGLHDFIEIVLGLICYAAILLMAIFTGFDIVAIILPGARSKLDGVAQKGGALSRDSKSTGEAKFVFLTDDCIDALKEASETGKKPLLLYLKKRSTSYIAIAVVIYMLATSNIGLFVNLALKAISGFMDTLSNIASQA